LNRTSVLNEVGFFEVRQASLPNTPEKFNLGKLGAGTLISRLKLVTRIFFFLEKNSKRTEDEKSR